MGVLKDSQRFLQSPEVSRRAAESLYTVLSALVNSRKIVVVNVTSECLSESTQLSLSSFILAC